MTSFRTYQLQVGEKGAPRLELLNQLLNPTSLWVLDRAGLKTGNSILDVGCGIGRLSIEMAHRVGPSGRVVAIDYSREQLDIAQANAEAEGIENISFVEISAENLTELNQCFDIVFCRFVLCHLPQPEQILREICECVKPGGHLVNEELARIDTAMSYPEQPAYTEFASLARKVVIDPTVDKEIGKRLPPLLKQQGFSIVEGRFFHPIQFSNEQKQLITMSAEEFAPFVIKSGVKTKEEIEQLIAELKAAAEDDNWYCTGYEYIQLISQKPTRPLDISA